MGRTPFYTAVTCRRYTIVEVMLRMTGIKFNKKDVSQNVSVWFDRLAYPISELHQPENGVQVLLANTRGCVAAECFQL